MCSTLLRLATLSLLSVAIAPAQGAGAARGPLPRLVGDATRIECTDALELARASFFGTSFALDMPSATPPATLRSHFVLDDSAFNEDAASSIDPAFERLAMPANSSYVTLWERGDALPWRWVVTRNDYSWRGDEFGLYVVNTTMSQEAFLANKINFDPARPEGDPRVTTIFEGLQRPPYVLRPPLDGAPWVLDGGEPWRPLVRWKIFVRGESGPLSPCGISFGLGDSQQAVSLLPSDLAKLDVLLLDALGPGTGEGTLHPTARIQVDVRRTWANIALRPWSLPQPYNTRDEVEAGLMEWGLQDADQKAELTRIHALIPLAERSLANYYRHVFGISQEQARRSAAHAIDIALRMHFVFHSERAKASGPEAPEPNPWPANVVRSRDRSGDSRR